MDNNISNPIMEQMREQFNTLKEYIKENPQIDPEQINKDVTEEVWKKIKSEKRLLYVVSISTLLFVLVKILNHSFVSIPVFWFTGLMAACLVCGIRDLKKMNKIYEELDSNVGKTLSLYKSSIGKRRPMWQENFYFIVLVTIGDFILYYSLGEGSLKSIIIITGACIAGWVSGQTKRRKKEDNYIKQLEDIQDAL